MAFINKSKLYDNFTVVPNEIINSPNLSGRSKWLLIYLLSKPEDWKVSITDLTNHCTDGRDSLYSSIKELVDAGYAQKVLIRKDNGKISGYNYFIYDQPFTEKPFTANPTLVNTDITNNSIYTMSNDKDISLKDELEKALTTDSIQFRPEEEKPKVYGNEDINLAKEWLIKKYPKPLREIDDRIRLKNFIQVLSPRKGSADTWMSTDWKENLVSFMEWYLIFERKGYEAESVYNLNQIIKAWREKAPHLKRESDEFKTVNNLID